jgi:hypothetical protein
MMMTTNKQNHSLISFCNLFKFRNKINLENIHLSDLVVMN